MAVLRPDAVSFAGARRCCVSWHPGQADPFSWSQDGSGVRIENRWWLRKNVILVLWKRGFDDHQRRVWRWSSMRCRNGVFIAAAATSASRRRVRKSRKHGGGKCERAERRRIMDTRADRHSRPTGQQKKERSENRAVRNQGNALGARRPPRFIELQEMDGRAVCRRRFEMRRNKKLAQVFSNSIEPGFRCGIVVGNAKEWIVHAQASVSASRFGPTRSGGGHQSASQKSSIGLWLPAVKILSIQRELQARTGHQLERRELIQHGKSIEPESHFNRHLHGDNLAARSCSWSKLPGANGLDCFFPEAHAGILNDGNVDGATIGSDGHL